MLILQESDLPPDFCENFFLEKDRQTCMEGHPPHSSHPAAPGAAQSGNCNPELFWNLSTSPKHTAAAIYRKLSSFLLTLSCVFLASSTAMAKHAMDLSSASSFPSSSCDPLAMQSTVKATSRSNFSFMSIDISRRRLVRTTPALA